MMKIMRVAPDPTYMNLAGQCFAKGVDKLLWQTNGVTLKVPGTPTHRRQCMCPRHWPLCGCILGRQWEQHHCGEQREGGSHSSGASATIAGQGGHKARSSLPQPPVARPAQPLAQIAHFWSTATWTMSTTCNIPLPSPLPAKLAPLRPSRIRWSRRNEVAKNQ